MNKPITDQIIEGATGWDECGDFGDVVLYNGRLKIDTLNHKKGDIIPSAAFMLSKGVAEFYDVSLQSTETFTMNLSLTTK